MEMRDVPRINHDELLRLLQEAEDPVLVWGPPGVGKTYTILEFARKSGRYLLRLDCGPLSHYDLGGYPLPAEEGFEFRTPLETLKLTPPTSEAPVLTLREAVEQGRDVVIFFDDISASQEVSRAVWAAVQFRRLGACDLPDNVKVVLAANPPSREYSTFPLPVPLRTRCMEVYLPAPTPQKWSEWAQKEGLHPDVVAFVASASYFFKDQGDILYCRIGDKYVTPRNWEMASRQHEKGLSIAPAVGETLAELFASFRDKEAKEVKWDELVSGNPLPLEPKYQVVFIARFPYLLEQALKQGTVVAFLDAAKESARKENLFAALVRTFHSPNRHLIYQARKFPGAKHLISQALGHLLAGQHDEEVVL